MTRVGFLIAVLSMLPATTVVRGADEYAVTVESHVTMKTRDGVVLHADIYRPTADGKFPVLLQRTPYNKDGGRGFGLKAAARGYLVVIQDVRGRYASEGEWYTFKHESEDGYDAVEWAASLPNSDGRVGMFGGSYVGATQMLTAIAHPPHLAGICPVVTASNYHSNWTYQGGAFEQWFNQSWTTGLAQDTLIRSVRSRSDATRGSWQLPLGSYPLFNPAADGQSSDAAAAIAPYYLDWIAHPSEDAYWKQWSIEAHFADITVPALSIVAWYDIFQDGSFRNYMGIKAHGGTDVARNGQHLTVIVGGHAGNGPMVGDVDFGPASKFDEDEATISWYDYLFKHVKNDYATRPVKIFVMGTNVWRFEDEWPLARAKEARYYLHSQGQANSLRGTGSLNVIVPGAEAADKYAYDPANPTPTIGGPLCCDGNHLKAGPRDQRSVEARDDVLVYTTPPLTADLEVTGPVSLELFAKSSAVDTDFTAKLVDVWPNGFAQNLTEGILRARYRESQEKPTLINPGQIYKLTVDLWSTSNVFKQGHSIRLEISSSNFPRFDRNMNTGADNGTATRFVTATNTILHDAAHPSALVLPIVP